MSGVVVGRGKETARGLFCCWMLTTGAEVMVGC
jgi:hypothetical protein